MLTCCKRRLVRIQGGAVGTSSVTSTSACGTCFTQVTSNPAPPVPAPLPNLAALTATKTGTVIDNNPALSQTAPGDEVQWSIKIDNTGNGAASNLTVVDGGVTHPAAPATIAPGGSLTVPITPRTVITQAMLDGIDQVPNTAEINFNDGATQKTQSVQGSVRPGIGAIRFNLVELSKTGTTAGSVITYRLRYANLGNTTHTDLALTNADGINFSGSLPATRAPFVTPGDVELTGTYTITAADVAAGKVEKQLAMQLRWSPWKGLTTQPGQDGTTSQPKTVTTL